MEIRVLGPLELVGEDGPIPLAAAKQRQLLAALVVHAGATCAPDVLVDALWGASPPASAAKLLQVYVSQLRRVLPAPARIRTREAGYQLDADGRSIDCAHFERLIAEGRAAWRAGNPALTVSLLRRALGLWRGRAYGELADMEFARLEAYRLEELRLVALEERIEAELALGRHAVLLPELTSLAAAERVRERLQAQAMLALYRCGRQAEALDLYAATRAHMRNELGLEPDSELRELQRRILAHDPDLLAVVVTEPAAHILPSPPNLLMGRDHELEQVRALLSRDDVRLLVLTGAGGSGKTRLALEVARDTRESFANGAAFVSLAPVRDPALVVGSILWALGIEDVSGEPLETLASALRGCEILLVLDNVEHLRAAAPILVELLARAPRLSLLVTSRVVLHLSGEHIYPVAPLSAEAATALFLQRAREAGAEVEPNAVDGGTIRRICQRLDGLPLAIELAARRVRTLTLPELLNRLESRLPLLTVGPRDLPARQRTLRATLAWSFDLLDEDRQRDHRRLSVFAGGFTFEASEVVCGSTLDSLAELIDHNHVQHITTTDGSRYTMLETTREYAAERLEEAPEAEEVRRRHAKFFLAVAKSANIDFGRLAARPQRLEIAHAEKDNVRAALAWTLASGFVALGLELAVAMDHFWVTSDPREGVRWFHALLEHPGSRSVAPELRAHALRSYGSCAAITGDDEAARRLWERSLALFEQLGDAHARGVVLDRLGTIMMTHGDLDRARSLAEETRVIHERNVDPWERGWGLAQTTGLLGAIARDTGEWDRAFDLISQSASMAREVGVSWWESGMLAELAALSLNVGWIDEAEMDARHSLTLAEQLHDRAGRVFGVGLLACISAQRGRLERAGRLWGAIEGENGVAPLGGWWRHRETCAARIRAAWGPELERGRAEGRALSLDIAVSLALGSGDA